MLRILTTNDFLGALFAHDTSHGGYHGAAALVDLVDRLRDEHEATLWIDCGDYASGPLAAMSGGVDGFLAAGELGIDIGVPGNHDLDWGEEHLLRWYGETGFPHVVANYDLGLPPCLLLPAGGYAVGVIGLTHPQLWRFNDDLLREQQPPEKVVPVLAEELRAQGADFVVVAMHDGIDWRSRAAGPPHPDPRRITKVCERLREHADLVLGGHSLGRYIGELAGVPFVQPWPMGAELGVAELTPDGSRTYGLTPKPTTEWRGIGSDAHRLLSETVLGERAEALYFTPRQCNSLGVALARGMAGVTGAELGVVSNPALTQAPIDGTLAYLAAGPVTGADLTRVVPEETPLCIAEFTLAEIARFEEAAAGPPGPREDATWNVANLGGLAWWGKPRGPVVSVAVRAGLRAHLERWAGRSPEWTVSEQTAQDAFRHALA